MAFLPNKPAASDKLKNSQPDIKNNFTEIDTSFSVNHETIGSGADEGKHKFVTYTLQTVDPPETGSELVLFNRVPATPAIGISRALFIRKSSAGNRQFVPITSGTATLNTAFSDAAGSNIHAFVFLGTGLCMKFGNTTIDSLGAGGMGALANNSLRSSYISLNIGGPDFLATTKYIGAHITLCPENALNVGSENTMIYLRWSACTNTRLALTIQNRTGAAMPANTRIIYQVIGQVDLTTT